MVEFINDGGYHDVVVTLGPDLLSLPPCSGPCTIGTLTFDLAGTYDYICSIGSHASNGMVGTIEVGIGGCMDQSADNYDENAGNCAGVSTTAWA